MAKVYKVIRFSMNVIHGLYDVTRSVDLNINTIKTMVVVFDEKMK